MRFNNILAQGGELNDNEKEEIIDKLMNSICDMCHQKKPFRELCIDHDHQSGKYRGVICLGCNTALGILESDEVKERARHYLEQN
jgi:hypothetical protein